MSEPVEHTLVGDNGRWACTCGGWVPPLGKSVHREFDKHLLDLRQSPAAPTPVVDLAEVVAAAVADWNTLGTAKVGQSVADHLAEALAPYLLNPPDRLPRVGEEVTVAGTVRNVETLWPDGHYRITLDTRFPPAERESDG